MKTGIYKITNTANNKCYIGSSINVGSRIGAHKNKLNGNRHTNPHLARLGVGRNTVARRINSKNPDYNWA